MEPSPDADADADDWGVAGVERWRERLVADFETARAKQSGKLSRRTQQFEQVRQPFAVASTGTGTGTSTATMRAQQQQQHQQQQQQQQHRRHPGHGDGIYSAAASESPTGSAFPSGVAEDSESYYSESEDGQEDKEARARSARDLSVGALDERLAQLDEEARMVRRQLRGLGATDIPSSPLQEGGAHDRAAHARIHMAEPLLLSGECRLVEQANDILSPLLLEYSTLTNALREGCRMRMVLERAPRRTRGDAAAREPLHRCVDVFVWVDDQLESFHWALCDDDADDAAEEREEGSDRSARRKGSGRGKPKESDSVFCLPLEQMGAIFCGGEREGRLMGAAQDCIFRLHVQSPGAAMEPLQLQAPSSQERQTWAVGLGLFRHLTSNPAPTGAA